jgi:hypothetical protein
MKLKNIAKLSAATLALAVASSSYAAPSSKSAVFKIRIELFQVLTIANTSDLDFGNWDVGARTETTDTGNDGDGDHITAKFDVTGQVGKVVTFTVQNATTTLSNGGTGTTNQLDADTFKVYDPSNVDITAGTHTLVSGTNVISVGGVANVLAEDLPGEYTGTNTLTVAYQ